MRVGEEADVIEDLVGVLLITLALIPVGLALCFALYEAPRAWEQAKKTWKQVKKIKSAKRLLLRHNALRDERRAPRDIMRDAQKIKRVERKRAATSANEHSSAKLREEGSDGQATTRPAACSFAMRTFCTAPLPPRRLRGSTSAAAKQGKGASPPPPRLSAACGKKPKSGDGTSIFPGGGSGGGGAASSGAQMMPLFGPSGKSGRQLQSDNI